MAVAGVVECRAALHSKADRTANGFHGAHDLLRILLGVTAGFASDGHEIRELGHALVAEEARDENVGVRQIHLLNGALALRGDREEAALSVVENGSEDARR